MDPTNRKLWNARKRCAATTLTTGLQCKKDARVHLANDGSLCLLHFCRQHSDGRVEIEAPAGFHHVEAYSL
jgi:hypothetical protein